LIGKVARAAQPIPKNNLRACQMAGKEQDGRYCGALYWFYQSSGGEPRHLIDITYSVSFEKRKAQGGKITRR
jgi:hypothetical protein